MQQAKLHSIQGQKPYVIALAGNPNVGKSTVFNALTGLHQHTGNWPGKTVATAQGDFTYHGASFTLVDLPGTYSLFPNSVEEEITRDYLCANTADAILIVADATCLSRNLALTLQIIAVASVPIVLCVNLLDEAKKKGISIDLDCLSSQLGIQVVGTAARSGDGLTRVKDAIFRASLQKRPHIESTSLPEHDDTTAAAFISQAEAICHSCVTMDEDLAQRRDRRLDRLLTSKRTGIPVMLALLGLILWLTIVGANFPSQILSSLFSSWQEPLRQLLSFLPAAVCNALVDGVYRTLAWVVAVMLPPMAIFFPLFTLLEDAGYLPRVAFNLDRCFACAGAHGRQSLTMCMGFGCNACGVTGCRIIDSPRERLIAMLTNNFVPCNGRFPLLIALLSIFFVNEQFGGTILSALLLLCAIVFSVLMTLLASKLLATTVLRGEHSAFSLELPPYRCPQFGQVIVRSLFDRTLFVLGRAVTVAAPAGLLIYLLGNIQIGGLSLLAHIAGFFDPFARLLGLDGMILLAFLLGFPANEIVLPVLLMGYCSTGTLVEYASLGELQTLLLANGWTGVTALCVILFSLLHFPCGTTCLTLYRETKSIKWTLLGIALPTAFGLFTCFLVHTLAVVFRII